MQRTAQMWLVYTVTKSPLMVGLIGVAQFTPLLLFSLFAGVIVDRLPKKKLLIGTQALFMLQAVLMTVLTYTEQIQYWHIVVLSFLFGLTQTIDMPTRQSFFIDLVGPKDLTNAISLNSTIVNLAKIVGPAFSGIVMVKFGMTFCFFLNAVSYIPVMIGIFLISAKGISARGKGENLIQQVVEGLKYIRKSRVLVINVFATAAVCTFAMNNDVIIPVFAGSVLRQGSDGYSLLLSMAGLGAFVAAVMMAYLSKNGVKRVLLPISGIASALLQVLTLVTRQFAVCALLIGLVGFFNLLFVNTSNSLFQTNSSNEFRGRVMSVYSFLNLGSTPIGNFLAGSVMESAGGGFGYVFCGGMTLMLLLAIFAVQREEILKWFSPSRKKVPQEV